MIHIYMRGRLGNQLFQYAFIRHLQKYNPNQKICYHFDEVYNAGLAKDGFENSLKYFNTIGVVESNKMMHLSILQRVMLFFYWHYFPHKGNIYKKNKYQKSWVWLLSKVSLYYLDLGYYKFPTTIKDDLLVSGNFESPKYFDDIRNELLHEITPKESLIKHNQVLYNKILTTNSVCVSIRRGDYINNESIKGLHNVCNSCYYEQALQLIGEKVKNPTIFFFSDDIEWVKQNIKSDYPSLYENGDDPVWEKLRLMSSCKHFIISNSTFSWWAQYLSTSCEKIVIAPERWYNSKFVPDLYMDDWIIIKIK